MVDVSALQSQDAPDTIRRIFSHDFLLMVVKASRFRTRRIHSIGGRLVVCRKMRSATVGKRRLRRGNGGLDMAKGSKRTEKAGGRRDEAGSESVTTKRKLRRPPALPPPC